jgi:hypothetical protein
MPIAELLLLVIWKDVSPVAWAQVWPESVLFHSPALREP